MGEVKLYSAGVEYRGFKGVSITKSITSLVGTFVLQITEKEISKNRFYLMSPGDPAEVRIVHDDGREETVVTGYIDKRELSYGKSGRQITVSGRDKALDLIDCSCEIENENEHNGRDFLELAQKLAQPYGVRVTQSSSRSMKVKDLSIEPGKTVFEVLEEQARTFGVLLISNGAGVVDIAEPGKTRAKTKITDGLEGNLKNINVNIDVSGLFTDYRVLAQSDADDDLNLEGASEIEGKAQDALLKRKRNLTTVVEKNATQEDAQKRAEWEAATRRARARTVSVTVPTWFQKAGVLWKPNELVTVICEPAYVGLNTKSNLLLAEEVQYNTDARGSSTTLKLISKNAFIPEPLIPKEEDDLFS